MALSGINRLCQQCVCACKQWTQVRVIRCPHFNQRLLVGRNKSWIPKIEALFARRGHALVVVGAAHLVGPDGLVAMLKAKGYAVEQM